MRKMLKTKLIKLSYYLRFAFRNWSSSVAGIEFKPEATVKTSCLGSDLSGGSANMVYMALSFSISLGKPLVSSI